MSGYLLSTAGLFAVFQGMQQILLPSQVASIDEAGKVASLGVLASLGALAAAVGNPLFGAMSDKTRSRFGRRTPWLVASAIGLTGLLALMGSMHELLWLGVVYVGVMLSAAAYQAVLTSLLPERVPVSRRGLISSLMGIATTLGVIYGLNLAPAFVQNPVVGYLLLVAVLVVGTLFLVFLAPDPLAGRDEPEPSARPRLSASERVSSFAAFFAGLRDHDFAWAFWARVTIMVGFWTVSAYQYYALTDYIGVENLPGGDPATAVALLGTVNLGFSILSTAIAGPLSDRIGRRKIFVIIASVGIGIGMLIPVFVPTFAGMLVWAVVVGLSYGAYASIDQALMTEVLPDEEHNARDLGLLNVATAGPQIAAPFLAAVIIGATGAYPPIYIFAAVVALLASVFIIPIRKVR
ncbi:MFS transporter [Microbacterium sp. P5_E9]